MVADLSVFRHRGKTAGNQIHVVLPGQLLHAVDKRVGTADINGNTPGIIFVNRCVIAVLRKYD